MSDDIIRPAGPDDMAFVRESAAKVRWQKDITFRAHRAEHDRQLDQLIAAGGRILVATIHGVILGFVIAAPNGNVSNLYVKKDFRGHGVGLALLATLPGADLTKPVRAYDPTPSFRMWAQYHGIKVVAC